MTENNKKCCYQHSGKGDKDRDQATAAVRFKLRLAQIHPDEGKVLIVKRQLLHHWHHHFQNVVIFDECAVQHKLVNFIKEGGILVVVPLFNIGYLFFNGAIALQEIMAFECAEPRLA